MPALGSYQRDQRPRQLRSPWRAAAQGMVAAPTRQHSPSRPFSENVFFTGTHENLL